VRTRFACLYVTLVTAAQLALSGCYGLPPPPRALPPPKPAPGWIQGIVKDGQLEPEQDVLVEARTTKNRVLSGSARTDAHGYYKLTLAPDDYTVVFTFPNTLQLAEPAHVTSDRVACMYETDPMPVLPFGPGYIPNCSDIPDHALTNACFP
jgi:hypothetical protein